MFLNLTFTSFDNKVHQGQSSGIIVYVHTASQHDHIYNQSRQLRVHTQPQLRFFFSFHFFPPLLTARSATLVSLRMCRILLRTTNVMFVMRREMASTDMVSD